MKINLCWVALTALVTLQAAAHADSGTGTDPHADLCNEQAPLLDSGYYYELNDSAPIPARQIDKLQKFARLLHGTWRGQETNAQCLGNSHPGPVLSNYELQAEITSSAPGAIRLSAEKELIDAQISKLQTLWLTPESRQSGNHQRWHTLEFIDANTLIYSHKYRARNNNGFMRLVHEVNKLSYQSRKLTIDRKLYVNGEIAEQSGFSLKRAAG